MQVWQKAMTLAKLVYEFCTLLQTEEKFGLADQMRRAAVSVPSNIAEGHGRYTDNEFLRFLAIANGSLNELKTQLYLAQSFYPYLSERSNPLLNLTKELGSMLRALSKAIKR